MTITYPLSWPTVNDVAPKQVKFYGVNSVALSRSPFTYDTQTQDWMGQSWGCEITLPPMIRETAEAWVAFLAALRGPRGTFLAYDPLSVLPKGQASGNPKVNGGSQTGNTLVTDGWGTSVTGILKAGDKIQIGNYLHMVLLDANSDSSGNATLDIWPRLRESPVDNQTIITVQPKGIFRLSSQVVDYWTANETQTYDVSFQAVEAI